MRRNNTDNNSIIKYSIEQIPVRVRRAGKKDYQLAKAAGITAGHLSQIINFRIKSPHSSTLDKIGKVLTGWGV